MFSGGALSLSDPGFHSGRRGVPLDLGPNPGDNTYLSRVDDFRPPEVLFPRTGRRFFPFPTAASPFPASEKMHDLLGDYIKSNMEKPECGRAIPQTHTIMVRLDGRAFSTFTRGMEKPFDPAFAEAMIGTASHLVEHFKAEIAYVQSDEINLVLRNERPESEHPFGGKIQKICSVFAGLATAKFNMLLPARAHLLPHFDARAFGVDRYELSNAVLMWREADAIRNAILSLGQMRIGKKRVHGMGTRQVAELLRSEYNAQPLDFGEHYAYGTYLKRVTRMVPLSAEQRSKIPEAHRPPEDAVFERAFVEKVPSPFLSANRKNFLDEWLGLDGTI